MWAAHVNEVTRAILSFDLLFSVALESSATFLGTPGSKGRFQCDNVCERDCPTVTVSVSFPLALETAVPLRRLGLLRGVQAGAGHHRGPRADLGTPENVLPL